MTYLWSTAKILAVSLALLWLLLRWLESVSIYHPTPFAAPDPGAYGLRFDTIYLEGGAGSKLRAWYIYGHGPITLLYSGGNGESAAATIASPSWRKMMAQLGVNVLVWDYPGYGASEGRPSEESLYQGARAALAYLRSHPDVDPGQIVLWGHSLGSAIAAEIAASEPVGGLILQAPLASTLEMGREMLGPLWYIARALPGLPLQRFDTLTKLARVKAPILILHGEADEVIPVRHGRLLRQSLSGAALIEVKGAGHMSPWDLSDTAQFDAYYHPVAAWLSAQTSSSDPGKLHRLFE